jgi:hypothetical protein
VRLLFVVIARELMAVSRSRQSILNGG